MISLGSCGGASHRFEVATDNTEQIRLTGADAINASNKTRPAMDGVLVEVGVNHCYCVCPSTFVKSFRLLERHSETTTISMQCLQPCVGQTKAMHGEWEIENGWTPIGAVSAEQI